MLTRFRTFAAALAASAVASGCALVTSSSAFAQGPFTPHEGLTITRAYTSQYLLAGSPGQAFSRGTILQRVWGWGYEGTERTVDNFVASLRKKLGSRDLIRTVPRLGYRFDSN